MLYLIRQSTRRLTTISVYRAGGKFSKIPLAIVYAYTCVLIRDELMRNQMTLVVIDCDPQMLTLPTFGVLLRKGIRHIGCCVGPLPTFSSAYAATATCGTCQITLRNSKSIRRSQCSICRGEGGGGSTPTLCKVLDPPLARHKNG